MPHSWNIRSLSVLTVENPATHSGCRLLFLIELSLFSVAGRVILNVSFKSLDKPKLSETLLTIFCIPSKLLCYLFNISKTICLNNK